MKNGLKKDLGLLDIFCLASGAMISSGIFILPGLAYAQAGPLVFISYFLAGMLALMGTLSIIELATAMPKAGGDYFFITRSLGPFVGTVSSFLSWSALCLKSAFAVFGIAEILYLAFGFPVLVSSFFICCFFVVLNILGVKEAARLEV
ncbi:MAG: amino acid permease, partial [Candidatus Omnitrophica bacterium]|nr:amino acid permease [Candidatus Omnitrophota bacterium]